MSRANERDFRDRGHRQDSAKPRSEDESIVVKPSPSIPAEPSPIPTIEESVRKERPEHAEDTKQIRSRQIRARRG